MRDAAAVAQVDLADHLLAKCQLQVGAHDAQQPTVQHPFEACVVQSRAPPAGLVDIADFLNPVAEFLQTRQNSHSLSSVVAEPEEVHHIALGARTRRSLDHHHIPADGGESLREGQPRDSGATNHCFHLSLLSFTHSCAWPCPV